MSGPRHLPALALLATLAPNLVGAEASPNVPLAPGLTIVTAISGSEGDYESIKLVESMDAKSVRLRYSAETPHEDGIDTEPDAYRQCRPFPGDNLQVLCMTTVHRNVLRSDLASADHFARVFEPPPAVAETVPGTTAIGVSAAVLKALKTRGSVDFTTYMAAFDAVPLTSADATAGQLMDPRQHGTLQRVEMQPVPVSVILNGRKALLPAIHAKGVLGVDDAEFYFLDNPDNALVLRYAVGNDHLTVIKINSPGGDDAAAGGGGAGGGAGSAGNSGSSSAGAGVGGSSVADLEQSLADKRHVDIYGIYFSFNSDIIRPESEAVLRQIATLLAKHPDWKLQVDGHTDSIGGAPFNLDLSKRRAAAVKKALVERYQIAPARLQTDGFGLSRPNAPNDTLEGRALNRRVELFRP